MSARNPSRQRKDEHPAARVYPDGLRGAMQALLAALADMEVEHAEARARIERSDLSASIKQRALGELEERHQDARAPYVQELDRITDRIRSEFFT